MTINDSVEVHDGFALDDGEGTPGVVPVAVLGHDPLKLRVAYLDGRIIEVGGSDVPLPASHVAQVDDLEGANGEVMWVVSLASDASVDSWVRFWLCHCSRVIDCILGEWLPDRSVPALHVRGYTTAGAAVTLSVPLISPARQRRVELLIGRDQQQLLDEAVEW